MLRALIRLIVIVVVLAAAAAFFLGYRLSDWTDHANRTEPLISTSGTTTESADRARQTESKIGDEVAVGAERAKAALEETRLTAKVKSKIALDDTLKGTRVEIHTTGTSVTASGHVATRTQRERVLQLARETQGVTDVVDKIEVR